MFRQHAMMLAAAAALTTLAAGPARAGGGLSVSPITIEFSQGANARALEVSNPGDEPIDVQIRLFGWTVDETGDHHAPSQDIGFSPPMFHLAAGARQIVRLAPQRPATDREAAYRLFVDQLPGPPKEGQLQLPVRMVLPVFVSPRNAAERRQPPRDSRLTWRASRDPATGKVLLSAANADIRRAKLLNLAYEADGVSHVVQKGLAGYVLAGETRGWTFAVPGRPEHLTVTAEVNDSPISAQVALAVD